MSSIINNNNNIIEKFLERLEMEKKVKQLEEVEDFWKVKSFDKKRRKEGMFYWVVKFKNGEWVCDCPAFIMKQKVCKHILEVKKQTKKNGF